MSPERLEHLTRLVAPHITKKFCRSRDPISPSERLCLCVRYLATGDSQLSHSLLFRVGRSTVSNIVRETCDGIWQTLQKTYMKCPQNLQDWLKIANEFIKEWNFPNCLGAVDGKHVCIECPRGAGSTLYKHFHSVVLMAVCDAKYCFSLVDIGAYRRDNDAAILSGSLFGQMFQNRPSNFNIPAQSLF